MVEGRAVPWDLLVKDVPPENHHDLDYISTARLGRQRRSRIRQASAVRSQPVRAADEMADARLFGEVDRLLDPHYSAKELTVFPGRSVTIRGRRGLRPDRGAGLGLDRQDGCRDAFADPLRADDQGRVVRQCGAAAAAGSP